MIKIGTKAESEAESARRLEQYLFELKFDREELSEAESSEAERPVLVGSFPLETPADELPESDGIPMETANHYWLCLLLAQILENYWRGRNDFFVGSNAFLYYPSGRTRRIENLGPDLMCVKQAGVGSRYKNKWVMHEEGVGPCLVVEVSSPSTVEKDLNEKREIYEREIGAINYVCVNEGKKSLLVWELVDGSYVKQEANGEGRYWLTSLSLWLGFEEVNFREATKAMLRLFSAEGDMILTAEEEKDVQMKASERKAERQKRQKETAQRQAEEEKRQKETAQRQAEEERQRAETAERQAEEEREHRDRLEAELRQLREKLKENESK